MLRRNARIERLVEGLGKSSDRLHTGTLTPGFMAVGDSKGVSGQDLRSSVRPLVFASCGWGLFSKDRRSKLEQNHTVPDGKHTPTRYGRCGIALRFHTKHADISSDTPLASVKTQIYCWMGKSAV